MPKELADLRPYHRSDVDWPLIVYQTNASQSEKVKAKRVFIYWNIELTWVYTTVIPRNSLKFGP
jgi:hypothetical protein